MKAWVMREELTDIPMVLCGYVVKKEPLRNIEKKMKAEVMREELTDIPMGLCGYVAMW